MTLISASVDWTTPRDPYQWHDATSKVLFSGPPNTGQFRTDFSKWFLLSIKLEKERK